MQPAIQNLDYLRQLIAQARKDYPFLDMVKLRMPQGTAGTGQVETKQGDR
jgi:hypothetical protein